MPDVKKPHLDDAAFYLSIGLHSGRVAGVQGRGQ